MKSYEFRIRIVVLLKDARQRDRSCKKDPVSNLQRRISFSPHEYLSIFIRLRIFFELKVTTPMAASYMYCSDGFVQGSAIPRTGQRGAAKKCNSAAIFSVL